MEQEKDYKKLYKDALELTRQKHEQARKDNNPIYCIYEEIFPQLAESDDEKIGKELFEFFSSALGKDLLQRKCGLNPDKVLSWFEKQKEREEGDRTYEAKIYWKGRSDAMEQKEQKHYWKPTENDVALFSKAVTTNEMLTPAERAQLDIIRSKFGYCRAVNCNGIVQKEQNPVEYTLQSSWDTSNKQEPTEWSKEDEKDIAHIIRVLDDCYAYGKHDLSKTDHENLVTTLKSLRSLKLVGKEEWSEKDEYILNNIFGFVKENMGNPNRMLCAMECLTWLQDLFKQKKEGKNDTR